MCLKSLKIVLLVTLNTTILIEFLSYAVYAFESRVEAKHVVATCVHEHRS